MNATPVKKSGTALLAAFGEYYGETHFLGVTLSEPRFSCPFLLCSFRKPLAWC